MNQPLLSVCITTYNHEKFIRKALESVLDQKVNFVYEILIGEDQSTDKTREICIELADKYPDKIKLYLHTRETVITINGRATGRYNFINNLKNAKGKYIALLDGDDYWTNPDKLQMAVNFLEKNKDFSFTFHACQIEENNNVKPDFLNETTPSVIDTLFLASNGNCIRTLSVVFRNFSEKGIPEFLFRSAVADFPVHVYNSTFGKGKYFNTVMGVYRKHAGGVWSTYHQLTMKKEWLLMLEEISQLFLINKSRKIWNNQLAEVSFSIARLLKEEEKEDSELFFVKSKAYSAEKYEKLMKPKLINKKDNRIKSFIKKLFK